MLYVFSSFVWPLKEVIKTVMALDNKKVAQLCHSVSIDLSCTIHWYGTNGLNDNW